MGKDSRFVVYRLKTTYDRSKALRLFSEYGMSYLDVAWDIMRQKDAYNNHNNTGSDNIDSYILVQDNMFVIDASSFQIYLDKHECVDIDTVIEADFKLKQKGVING